MLSVVCVFNNRGILEDYLLRGLSNQTVACDLHLMDNTSGRFESAARALNLGASQATGKYVVFVHQDIDLLSARTLENLEKTLDELPHMGIAGVAGKRKEREMLSNITNGTPPTPAGGERGVRISVPTRVQTLDECLFAIPRTVLQQLRFDEQVCDNWHLYAVDYSLEVHGLDLEAYVVPLEIYHRSTGRSVSSDYYRSLFRLLRKHGKRYRWIHTTMGSWRTGFIWICVYYIAAMLKSKNV